MFCGSEYIYEFGVHAVNFQEDAVCLRVALLKCIVWMRGQRWSAPILNCAASVCKAAVASLVVYKQVLHEMKNGQKLQNKMTQSDFWLAVRFILWPWKVS